MRRDPHAQRQKRQPARDQLQPLQFRVEPHQREQTQVRAHHEQEDQSRLRRHFWISRPNHPGKQRHHRQRRRCQRETPRVHCARARPRKRRDEQNIEVQTHRHRGSQFLRCEKFRRPTHLHYERSQRAQRHENFPTRRHRHRDQTRVQYGQIAEQPERIILPRREQHRREKAAENSQYRHHLRAQSHRQKKSRRSDQRHQQETQRRRERLEVVNRATPKRDRIQHHHARRAQRVRQHAIPLAIHHHATHDQANAHEETQRRPHRRRNQIVVERILDEVRNAEQRRQPAHPREQLHADELLPIDLQLGRRRCCNGRCYDRRCRNRRWNRWRHCARSRHGGHGRVRRQLRRQHRRALKLRQNHQRRRFSCRFGDGYRRLRLRRDLGLRCGNHTRNRRCRRRGSFRHAQFLQPRQLLPQLRQLIFDPL